MRFKSLELRNFKGIKQLKVNFSKLNLILGPNGSGKTSVLEAIAFILTDSLNSKLNDYIHWDADSFKIAAEFEAAGSSYHYTIDYGKQTKRKLVVDGKDTFLQSDAVGHIKSIINPVLTSGSALAMQTGSLPDLDETGVKRLESYRKLFGMNKIDKVIDLMSKDLQAIRQSTDSLRSEIEFMEQREYLFQEVPELGDKSEIQIKLDILETEKTSYEEAKEKYEKYLRDLEEFKTRQTEKAELSQDIELAKNRLGTLVLQSIPEYDENEIEALSKEISSVEKEQLENKYAWQSFYESQDTNLKLNNRLNVVKTKLSKLILPRILPLDFSKEDVKDLVSDVNALKAKVEELKTKESLAKDGRCPTCGQDFIQDSSVFEHERNNTEALIAEKDAKINSMQTKLDEFDEHQKLKAVNQETRSTLEAQVSELETDIKAISMPEAPKEVNYEDKLQSLYQKQQQLLEIREKSKRIEEENRQAETSRIEIEAGIKQKAERLKELSNSLEPDLVSKPTFDFDSYEFLKRELHIYEQRKSEIERIVSYNTKLKKEKASNDDKIKSKRDELDKQFFQLKLLEETRSKISKEFSSYLIEKGTKYITLKMNDFFGRCYNGRYKLLLKQDKKSIDFFYSADGGSYRPVQVASGWEKSLISLSIMLARSSLYNLGFIVLDEMDSFANPEKSLTVYENLLEYEGLDQIFCVTHKKETQEFLQNEARANVISLAV